MLQDPLKTMFINESNRTYLLNQDTLCLMTNYKLLQYVCMVLNLILFI